MSEIREGSPSPAWAHACGALEMRPPVRPEERSVAVERSLIVERMHRYCWGYDERRVDLLGDCFTDDAVWEGNVAGRTPVGPISGREGILDWLTGFWPHQHDQRRHMLVNSLIEEQSETDAVVLCYLLLTSAREEQVKLETIGFYRVRLSREGDAWRIAHLFAGFDAPFWPGRLESLSQRGRVRHGLQADDRVGEASS
jgi:hypothetical protein